MLKKIILAHCLILTGCFNDSGQKPTHPSQTQHRDGGQKFSPFVTPTNIIKVMDLAGSPLAGAQILIGKKLGTPFQNNWLTTDAAGQVNVPQEWTTAESVTVNLQGYLRVTYVQVTPQSLRFQLRPLEQNQKIELSGTTHGYGNLEKNNIVDFGVVVPSLTTQDLFTFSIDKIISSESDIIEVAGMEAKIPSNISLPKQKESYIVPLTLQKEVYRLFFNEFGPRQIYALHGRFPFKETVDKITQKVPFQTLVNDFDFQGGSLRSVDIQGPARLNLPVNEKTYTYVHRVAPPASLTNDKTMLSVALFEQNKYLYPTDIHKVESKKSFPLKNNPDANQKILSLLVSTSEFNGSTQSPRRGSAEMVEAEGLHTPEFLDLLEGVTPTQTGWQTKAPVEVGDIHTLSTYALLSKIEYNGSRKNLVRQWEVFAETWISELDLPEWPTENTQNLEHIDLSMVDASTENRFEEGLSVGNGVRNDSRFQSEVGLGLNLGNEDHDPNDESHLLGKSHAQLKANPTRRWEISYIGTNLKQPLPPATLGPSIIDYVTHVSFMFVEY